MFSYVNVLPTIKYVLTNAMIIRIIVWTKKWTVNIDELGVITSETRSLSVVVVVFFKLLFLSLFILILTSNFELNVGLNKTFVFAFASIKIPLFRKTKNDE